MSTEPAPAAADRAEDAASERARTPANRGTDIALAMVLLVGAAFYVDALPHVLGGSDEGIYLYEAKRLLDGEVFYRDVFDLITPGAHYLMAAAYAVFGASMQTARAVDAAMHASIAAATLWACRAAGVRRALAALAALAQLAIFQPAWPVASPHWLATLLGIVLVALLLGRPDRRHGLAAGVVAGLLIAVQQQKGAAFTAGAAAFLVGERVLGLRTRDGRGRIAAFGAGATVVVAPLALYLAATAGLRPVAQALILHPLFNYPRLNRAHWGEVGPFASSARYTFPHVLALAPWLALVPTVGAVVAGVRGARTESLRQAMLLAFMAVAAIASVLYYPDYVHLAFIGPVFALIAAAVLERVVGRAGRAAATLATVLVLAATGYQLGRVMLGRWRDAPFTLDTPFGRMRFQAQRDVDVVGRVRAVLDRSGARDVFVYPFGAGFYLLTGTSNPTPFQFLHPNYSRPDQLELAIAILERRRVPYVIVIVPMNATDPLLRYVSSHYEQVVDDAGALPLFRRRPSRAFDE